MFVHITVDREAERIAITAEAPLWMARAQNVYRRMLDGVVLPRALHDIGQLLQSLAIVRP